jgi:hypothetical protein
MFRYLHTLMGCGTQRNIPSYDNYQPLQFVSMTVLGKDELELLPRTTLSEHESLTSSEFQSYAVLNGNVLPL